MGTTYVCPFCLAGDCYTTAIMREPKDWRGLLSTGGLWKGPAGGHRYKVGVDPDNWWTVASKDGWKDPWDLIRFNFKTSDPAEVNWYLYHFVGCRVSTDGNKNLSFKKAKPGIIYAKKNHYKITIPPVVVKPKVPKPLFTRGMTWIGAGAKFGTMAATNGNSNIGAYMVNTEDTHCRFFLDMDTKRTGWGFGGSISTVVVVITGLYDPQDVKHAPAGEVDFDLAISGKWGALAKNAKHIGRLPSIVRAAKATRHIRNAATLAKFMNSAKAVIKGAGIDIDSTELKVHVVDLPVGGGLEGSLYWGDSSYRPHNIILTKDEWEDVDWD